MAQVLVSQQEIVDVPMDGGLKEYEITFTNNQTGINIKDIRFLFGVGEEPQFIWNCYFDYFHGAYEVHKYLTSPVNNYGGILAPLQTMKVGYYSTTQLSVTIQFVKNE